VHIGLVISVLLHLAILGWAVLTIQTQRDLRVAEPEPVAVDMMTPGEVTRLRQGVRTAKQMDAEAKEAPKPPDVVRKEAPKPTPPAVLPKPEPPPEPPKEEAKPEPPKPEPPKPEPPKEVAKVEPPKPVEPPKIEPPKDPIAEKLTTDQPDPALEQAKLEEQKREEQRKAEEQKKLDEQKQLEEARKQAELKKKLDEEKKRKQAELKKKADEEKKRKEAEAKKKFDADNIAALLNKVPDKGAPPSDTAPEAPSKNKGPVLGAREGRDKELSASERAVLAQIIRSCVQAKWNLSGGGEDAMNTVIKLRLQFRPDGTLSALPQVTNPQNTPYFLAASEGAVRAAQACEPYSLPPDKYEAWRDVLMTFSLREMMR
jgi:colicin import membrane protein